MPRTTFPLSLHGCNTGNGCVLFHGAGSDYGMAYVDADKTTYGWIELTYKIHIPANPPAKDVLGINSL